jgi:hypothetical protein
VCSIADFWPRVKKIPLLPGADLGEAVLCHTSDGSTAVRVTKPEFFRTDEDREAHLNHLADFYGKKVN